MAIQLSLSSQPFVRAASHLLSQVKIGVNFSLGQGALSISFVFPSRVRPLSGSQQMYLEPATRSAQLPSARIVRVQGFDGGLGVFAPFLPLPPPCISSLS